MATKNTEQTGKFILTAIIFIVIMFIVYKMVTSRDVDPNKKGILKTLFGGGVDDPTQLADIAEPTTTTTLGNSLPLPSGTTTAPTFNALRVVSRGSTGEEVTYIQQAINRVRVLKKLKPIGVDGKFGPETETSVNNLTGSKSTTYAKIKSTVIATFKANGKPNPYDGEKKGGTPLFGNPWLSF